MQLRGIIRDMTTLAISKCYGTVFADISISVCVNMSTTYFPSGKGLAENRKWLVVDAKGQMRTPAVGYQTEMGMRLRLWWVKLTS